MDWRRHIYNHICTFVFVIITSPWRWPQQWRKYVGENLVNKIHHKNEMHFVCYLHIMDLIKEQSMEHLKVTLHLPRSFLAPTALRL